MTNTNETIDFIVKHNPIIHSRVKKALERFDLKTPTLRQYIQSIHTLIDYTDDENKLDEFAKKAQIIVPKELNNKIGYKKEFIKDNIENTLKYVNLKNIALLYVIVIASISMISYILNQFPLGLISPEDLQKINGIIKHIVFTIALAFIIYAFLSWKKRKTLVKQIANLIEMYKYVNNIQK